jgi:hypothetical protein
MNPFSISSRSKDNFCNRTKEIAKLQEYMRSGIHWPGNRLLVSTPVIICVKTILALQVVLKPPWKNCEVLILLRTEMVYGEP